MVGNKHLKDQQDIADACNDYFSSIINNINKNKVNNKNNTKVFTTQYYLEQNYAIMQVNAPQSQKLNMMRNK